MDNLLEDASIFWWREKSMKTVNYENFWYFFAFPVLQSSDGKEKYIIELKFANKYKMFHWDFDEGNQMCSHGLV